MGKKMISIRFNEGLLKFLKGLPEVKSGGLTAYLEKVSKRSSGYKEKEV